MQQANARAGFATGARTEAIEAPAKRMPHRVWGALQQNCRLMRRIAASECRHRWNHVTREDASADPLARVRSWMHALAKFGLTEAEMMRFELDLKAEREAIYHVRTSRSLEALDLLECGPDGREDEITISLRVKGETPELLDEGARIDEEVARVSLERATARRARAQQLRSQRIESLDRLRSPQSHCMHA